MKTQTRRLACVAAKERAAGQAVAHIAAAQSKQGDFQRNKPVSAIGTDVSETAQAHARARSRDCHSERVVSFESAGAPLLHRWGLEGVPRGTEGMPR